VALARPFLVSATATNRCKIFFLRARPKLLPRGSKDQWGCASWRAEKTSEEASMYSTVLLLVYSVYLKKH
jgi:hypothetical protein